MTEKTERPANVVVSWCQAQTVDAAFMNSMLDMFVYDFATHRRIVDGGGKIARYSTVNVSSGRNQIVHEFLTKTEADWLLMVDTDMVFEPDTLERLLAAADPAQVPIVGALCFGTDNGTLFPTMYELAEEGNSVGFMRWKTFPLGKLVKVSATGAAFLLMHRTALTAIGQKFDGPFPWFQETALAGGPMGEDLTFCLRAGACGIPIHVHTGVPVGHVKPTLLTLDKYMAQVADEQSKEEPDAHPV